MAQNAHDLTVKEREYVKVIFLAWCCARFCCLVSCVRYRVLMPHGVVTVSSEHHWWVLGRGRGRAKGSLMYSTQLCLLGVSCRLMVL